MKIAKAAFTCKKQLSMLMLLATATCWAQPSFKGLENLFTTPKNYVVGYAPAKPVIDGNITDDVWKNALWTDYFRDIEGDGKPEPYYQTRVKMLWDDTYLYFAADIKDEHVWAYLKNHDEIVYYDNDFEIFIDPDNNAHQYFEFEVNALNTIFDLFLAKPYRTNSRELISWDAAGLRSAVKVHGTLNNPKDKDKGWTVEMAIPFKALTMGSVPFIPKEGTMWRINFSRVEWDTTVENGKYVKKKGADGKTLPENNWVWSPQGVINMHYPEHWGYLLFTQKQKTNEFPAFNLPYAEKQKQYLWLVYYRQKEYQSKNNRYATTLEELNITPSVFAIDGTDNTLKMEATDNLFYATIRSAKNEAWSINFEGLVEKIK